MSGGGGVGGGGEIGGGVFFSKIEDSHLYRFSCWGSGGGAGGGGYFFQK